MTQDPKALREQAAQLRQSAQYAEGETYYREMDQAKELEAQAAAIERRLKEAADLRRKELAKIHLGKKALGLDDDAYRDMLFSVARVRSAADLNDAGRKAVLDHLKAVGFRPRRKARVANRAAATQGQIKLIRHLWSCLAEAGVVKHSGEQALRSWVKSTTSQFHPARSGYDAPEFMPVDLARKVIERLKKWAGRNGVKWQ